VVEPREVDIAPIDPEEPDARACLRAYVEELDARFSAGFDPEQSISADADELRPPAGLLLIARLDGAPVGCGALKFHDNAPTELKRMWVSSAARGHGVGRKLLAALEDHALQVGSNPVLHLETNRALVEAIALYRSAGYAEVPRFNDEPYADHWFEKRLTPE
jgi:GNAT superfamily N-acetyltransferase